MDRLSLRGKSTRAGVEIVPSRPAADDGLAGPTGDRRWGTIGDVLAEMAANLPDSPAIVDVDRTVTFATLHGEVRRFARALLAAGVRRGDRVAIWAPNSWRWIVSALGAHSAGAAMVPINTRYTGREARHILERAEPKVLAMVTAFLGKDFPGMLRDAGYDPKSPPVVIPLDEGRGLDELFAAAGIERLADDEVLDRRVAELEGTDLSDIMFTSGTTGAPKGVMTSHSQNLRAYWDWSRAAGMEAGDRYAIINPFFHAFGYKAGWLSAFMHGATVYPHAVFEPKRVLDQVAAERITVLPGPPTLYYSLFELVDRSTDIGSLRLAITGASSIAPELVRRMKTSLGFERITTCYGMTEGTGVATITRTGDSLETVARTSGRALPGIELRIAGEAGAPAGPGEAGEIWLRGYNVMRGYLEDPEGSRAAVDDGGWLHTGDVGTLTEDGCLRVTDRLRDMFVAGGFNVYPAEVEACLLEHPEIAEAAVIGVPDERQGEVGKAFLVLREGANLDAAGVVEWSRERLANFKVPRQVALVSALPRNATGKVLKDELRKRSRTS